MLQSRRGLVKGNACLAWDSCEVEGQDQTPGVCLGLCTPSLLPKNILGFRDPGGPTSLFLSNNLGTGHPWRDPYVRKAFWD